VSVCGLGLSCIHQPVFGVSLEEHVQHTGHSLCVVIQQSIDALRSPQFEAFHEEVGNITYSAGSRRYGKFITVMEHHLPYEITHCYLPPNTGERTPP